MEIEDSDHSEDTHTNEEPIKETENKMNKKKRIIKRYDGESNTIKLSPIIRGFTESHIYEFILSETNIKGVSIRIVCPKNYPFTRLSQEKESPLYDARIAFIDFESCDDASMVANKLNDMTMPNTDNIQYESIVVAQGKNNTNLRDNTNWITITNISKDVTEQNILTHIQNNSGITNRPNGIYLYHYFGDRLNYTGHAIIECTNNSDATKCVQNLNLTTLGENNNKIWCTWRPNRKVFDRKEEELQGKTKKILLGNLHYTLKQNDILALCTKYGQVQTVEIWYDKSGYCTGCACITMATTIDATKLFEGLNLKIVKNLKIVTAYTIAKKKRTRGGGRGKRGGKRNLRGKGGARVKNRNVGIGGRNKLKGKNNTGRRGRGRSRGRGPKSA